MRVVVVGGHGFLGSRAIRALRGVAGVEAIAAGRRARAPEDVVVDLHRPATFDALERADVILNASSSHAAPPDALAAHCLARGLVLIEASSDRVVIERLLDAHRPRAAEGPGALVLGAGIFTGISNALAAHASAAVGGAASIELAVRSSPLSGAGDATSDLMGDALAVATRTIRGGARIDGPPIGRGPSMPFVEGERATLHVPFAEPVMVHASTGARDVAMYMAPVPAALRLAFLALPLALVRTRLFGALLRAWFRVLRGLLLRRVSSVVGLVAIARVGEREHVSAISFEDGFEAAGAALAATVLAIGRRPVRPVGTYLVDELVPLREMLEGTRALAPALRTVSRGLGAEAGDVSSDR